VLTIHGRSRIVLGDREAILAHRKQTYVRIVFKSARMALLPMAQSEELLTVAEVAAELKMNQQTIRN
jgi:hypothetical protein